MAGIKTSMQNRLKTGTRFKEKGRQPVKRIDLIPIKEAAFVSTPLELEERFAIRKHDEEPATDPVLLEELLEVDDVDLEIVDEDETPIDEMALTFERYIISHPGIIPEATDSPEVSPENVYPLIISPGKEDHFLCRFEAPRWMHGRIPVGDRKHISILRNFLGTLAGWLEEEKQDFLRNPIPENFVKNEKCRPDNCIVLQDGFLQRTNQHMPEHGKMTKSYLSRLYSKIWLFWPEWNMPLSAIFSHPYQDVFRRAWVVEGCLDRYTRATSNWREGRRYGGFSAGELNGMAQRFDLLDPEERLYLLCRTARMAKQIDTIYREIIDRIAEGEHG